LGRRSLHEDSLAWEACLSPPNPTVHQQCTEVITMGVPSVHTAFTDPESWAEEAVYYYCCVLRQSEPSMVYKTVFQYHQGCALASAFLQDAAPDSFLSLIARFCPNSMAPSVISNEDRSVHLFQVASAEWEGVPVANCDKSSSNRDGKLTILMPESQTDDDIAHFPAFIGDSVSEDSWVSWMPVADGGCIADFYSMEGLLGTFGGVYSLKADRAFVIEGLDEEAMLAKKRELTETAVSYQIVTSNCSHQLLRILAAGMGCDAEIIPFYLPSALINAMESMENSRELDHAAKRRIEDMIESFLHPGN